MSTLREFNRQASNLCAIVGCLVGIVLGAQGGFFGVILGIIVGSTLGRIVGGTLAYVACLAVLGDILGRLAGSEEAAITGAFIGGLIGFLWGLAHLNEEDNPEPATPVSNNEPIWLAPVAAATEESVTNRRSFRRTRADEVQKHCPYCMSQFILNDVVTVCASCHSILHADCWEENRGCATFGCEQRLR
jgi:uncharacterized protein YqgC (DUF456 family)